MVMDTLKEIEVKAQEAQGSLAEEFKAQYDQGYADGKASVVLPDPNNPDKIYTEADKLAAEQVARDEQIAADAAQVADLTKQVSDGQAALAALQADVDAKVAGAVAELKAKELVKLQALEAGVKDLEADMA